MMKFQSRNKFWNLLLEAILACWNSRRFLRLQVMVAAEQTAVSPYTY